MSMTDTAIDVASDVIPRTEPALSDRWRRSAGLILSVVVPLALGLAPLPLDPVARKALAVGAFLLIGWVAVSLPYA